MPYATNERVNAANLPLQVAQDALCRPDLSLLQRLPWIQGLCAAGWDHDPEKRPSFAKILEILKRKNGQSGEVSDKLSDERPSDEGIVTPQQEKMGTLKTSEDALLDPEKEQSGAESITVPLLQYREMQTRLEHVEALEKELEAKQKEWNAKFAEQEAQWQAKWNEKIERHESE